MNTCRIREICISVLCSGLRMLIDEFRVHLHLHSSHVFGVWCGKAIYALSLDKPFTQSGSEMTSLIKSPALLLCF